MTRPRSSAWWLALLLLAGAGPAVRADLFVSSEFSNAVLEYNGTTGAFVKSFASGNGLNEPEGLVFGPNGDLFVSVGPLNAVLEFNGTTGAFVKSFASGGGLSAPTFLVFSPTPVPEPSSLALLAGGGLLGARAARRRGQPHRTRRLTGAHAPEEDEGRAISPT